MKTICVKSPDSPVSATYFIPECPRTETDPDGMFSVVYLHARPDEAAVIAGSLAFPAVLAAIDGVDWERDLTPWPAKKAFRGGGDFSGGAGRYADILAGHVIPEGEKKAGLSGRIGKRMIAGYSLAGLFALYSLYRTGVFARAASVSGSLWYDGFTDFMRGNRPVVIPELVYFSLGDREKDTKSPRMAQVGDRTAEAERIMRGYGSETFFEYNQGGHFACAGERLTKGIRFICR